MHRICTWSRTNGVTISRFVVKTVFMHSTSLEMHRNRFRPGLRPGPHWGSLQRSLRPLAGGEGARRVLPKNPTPSSALRLRPYRLCCVVPQHPPKINPSYGLVTTNHALTPKCRSLQPIELSHEEETVSVSQECAVLTTIGMID